MIDRTIAPPIHHAVEFDVKLPSCDRYSLDNQIPVMAVNAGVEEVVQIEWVFEAGNALEERNMIAAATNHLLKNGTTTRTALEINEQIDFYGAFLSRSCHSENAVISLHCLVKYLPELLPVVHDIMTDSIFPQQELDLFIQNKKQSLAVNLLKCDFVANREIDVSLYGADHPYGKYSSADDLDALTREDLLAFYQANYTKGNLAMFVAGKLPANFQSLINQWFGTLPLKPFIPKANLNIPFIRQMEGERKIRIQNDPNGVQGAIRIGRPFMNRHHPDFQKMGVLNNIFGGYFGSRLMSNIREEKGYTYGIHSYFHNHVKESAWMISTEAGRDVCEAAIAEVYVEMQALRETPVEDEELLLVKNYMIGSVLGSLDGPFHIIGRWKNYFLHGIEDGESYFNGAITTIKTVSPDELQSLANKYLLPEMFYEMVVV